MQNVNNKNYTTGQVLTAVKELRTAIEDNIERYKKYKGDKVKDAFSKTAKELLKQIVMLENHFANNTKFAQETINHAVLEIEGMKRIVAMLNNLIEEEKEVNENAGRTGNKETKADNNISNTLMNLKKDVTYCTQLQNQIDIIKHPVFITTMDRTIIFCNKEMQMVFKKAKADIIGKKCYEVIHNTPYPIDNCQYAETCQSDINVQNVIEVGYRIYAESIQRVLDEVNNTPQYVIHTLEDITT